MTEEDAVTTRYFGRLENADGDWLDYTDDYDTVGKATKAVREQLEADDAYASGVVLKETRLYRFRKEIITKVKTEKL